MFKQESFSISEGELENITTYNIVTGNTPPDFDIGNINNIILDPTLFSLTPPEHQDETMDVATKYQHEQAITEFQPLSPRGPPERSVFPGTLDFQVEINASDTHKRKYLYSDKLNRIYVDMQCNFSVQFRWNTTSAPPPMYVRAIVVFSDDSHAEKRVERCTQHTYETSNANLSQTIVKNVLHSAREMKTNGVYYCGNPDLADSWYSVLVEFPTMSAGPFTHAFKFVCKNSCPNGINRRAIDIIFNLEDRSGYVYGRQTVGARVCACPRRDMNRDEDDVKACKKRVLTKPDHAKVDPTKAKKLKVEVKSSDLVTLPPIQVVGVRTAIAGLEVMLSIMEQVAPSKRNDSQAVDKYNKSIADLRSKIDELKGKR